jgi:hypothetical protein
VVGAGERPSRVRPWVDAAGLLVAVLFVPLAIGSAIEWLLFS